MTWYSGFLELPKVTIFKMDVNRGVGEVIFEYC
jgi:hypothetical protein